MRAAWLIAAALATGCTSRDALLFAVAVNTLPKPANHPTPEVTAVDAPRSVPRIDGVYPVAIDVRYVADHPVTDVQVQVLELGRDEVVAIVPPHVRSGVAHIRTELPSTKDARALTVRVSLIDARGVAGTPVIKKIELL